MLEPLKDIAVLVVDDDADTRDLFAFALVSQGAKVQTAASAAEAYLILRESAPAIIVADIGMPDEDGYDFVRKARDIRPDVPAVAVTGYATPLDEAKALEAGFVIQLSKPVAIETLVATVLRQCTRR